METCAFLYLTTLVINQLPRSFALRPILERKRSLVEVADKNIMTKSESDRLGNIQFYFTTIISK